MQARRCFTCNTCSRTGLFLLASVDRLLSLPMTTTTKRRHHPTPSQSHTRLPRARRRLRYVFNMRTARLPTPAVHSPRSSLQSHPSLRRPARLRLQQPKRLPCPDQAVAYVTVLRAHVRHRRRGCQRTFKTPSQQTRPPPSQPRRRRQRQQPRDSPPSTTPWPPPFTNLRVMKTTMLTRSLHSPS